MTEQTIVPIKQDPPAIESTATPEEQAAAEKIGWTPATRFRGDPELFIDAKEFIERGETILPIVNAKNRELRTNLSTLQTKATETETALSAALTKINEIEERHSVDRHKAVEQAKADTKAALAVASEAGDHAAIADLTGELIELGKPEPVKEVKPEVKTEPVAFVPDADLVAWQARNSWFGADGDKRKTAVALAVAQELREAGEAALGAPFFELVGAEVEKVFGAPAAIDNKVEGGRNGAGGDERVNAAGGTTYSSLPAEAKAHCMSEAKDFVGEGKKYNTDAEWQTAFATIYFQE